MTLQPDGRIVFAGFAGRSATHGQDWLVGRLLNPQGTPDGSFGTGGFVNLNESGTADIAYDVLVQPDGKVLVAGRVVETRAKVEVSASSPASSRTAPPTTASEAPASFVIWAGAYST